MANKTQGLLAALFVSAVFLTFFSGSAYALPELHALSVKYDPYPAQAGHYMNLWVQVINNGQNSADNVKAEIVPKYPFDIQYDSSQFVGNIGPYQDAIVQFKNVPVAADTVEGWNTITIKVSFDSGVSFTTDLSVFVQSVDPNLVIGSLKTSPSDILPGTDNMELDLELQNIGKGSAEAVNAKLALPPGFSPSNSYSDTFNYGTIGKDLSKTAAFFVDVDKSVKSGTYTANLSLQYKIENTQDIRSVTLPVMLYVKPSPSFSIDKTEVDINSRFGTVTGYIVAGNAVVKPSTLTQGDSGQLRITLKNTGDKESKSTSVRVLLQSDQPFTFDQTYNFVGDLQPGQSGDAVFTFSVDNGAAAKNYLMTAEIRHVEGDQVQVDDETFSIDVVGSGGSPSYLIVAAVVIVLIVAAVLGWRYARKR